MSYSPIKNKDHLIKIEPEFDPDWSWVAEAEAESDTRSKIENGSLFQVWIAVRVYDKSGEVTGEDSLGAVCITSEESFEDQINETVKEHGMVENAKTDLALKLKRILEANKGEIS